MINSFTLFQRIRCYFFHKMSFKMYRRIINLTTFFYLDHLNWPTVQISEVEHYPSLLRLKLILQFYFFLPQEKPKYIFPNQNCLWHEIEYLVLTFFWKLFLQNIFYFFSATIGWFILSFCLQDFHRFHIFSNFLLLTFLTKFRYSDRPLYHLHCCS